MALRQRIKNSMGLPDIWGGVKMALAGVKTHLSEDLMLVRYYGLNQRGLLERVAEIKKERALARVGKKADGKSIDDALGYANEDQIVPVVDEYLQREKADCKQLADRYRANANSGPAGIYNHAANEWGRIEKVYEMLSEVLNSRGLIAYTAKYEELKPALRPSARL